MRDLFYRFILKLSGDADALRISKFNNISFDTALPLWMLPFLIAGIFVLVYYSYSREKNLSLSSRIQLTILRAVIYVLLLLMLLKPVIEIDGEGSPKGKVPAVIDATESMNIKDMSDNKPRYESAFAVAAYINESSGKYKRDISFDFYRAGKEFEKIEDFNAKTGDLDYTSLNQMLQSAYRAYSGEYCPGIVLISDGAHNTKEVIDTIIRDFKKSSVPVYSCGIGKEKAKDVAIQYVLGDEIVFIDEKAKLFINIFQSGYTEWNFDLTVHLGEEKVHEGVYSFEKDGENNINLEYIPTKKGAVQMTVSVKPLQGETTEANNVYVRNLRVIDEKIRVLLLFGLPSWEMRYLAGAFERDKRVEFKIFLQEIDKRIFRDKSKESVFLESLPKDIQQLNSYYDIVIMSGLDLSMLPPGFLDNLRIFVQDKGGSVVVISDPYRLPFQFSGTVFEELLPIRLSEKRPRDYQDELFKISEEEHIFELTEDGMHHPLTMFSGDRDENARMWRELPHIYRTYSARALKPSAICLVNVESKTSGRKYPAIVFHSYGKGMVFFNSFDSSWRWRKEFGDRYFRDFWAKMVQFAGLPHLLEESAISSIFVTNENVYVGEKVSVRAKLNNPDFTPYIADSVELTITAESGASSILKMSPVYGRSGFYKADFTPDSPGILKLSVNERFAANPLELRVTASQKEFINSSLNKKLLEKISSETGGKYYDYENYKAILQDIWKNRPVVPMQARVELWDSMIIVLIVLCLLSVEWIMRKFKYLD